MHVPMYLVEWYFFNFFFFDEKIFLMQAFSGMVI